MKYLAIGLCAALLQACLGPFASSRRAGPLQLHLSASSLTGKTELNWEEAPGRQFLHYQIERSAGGEFVALARLEDPARTAYTDADIAGDTAYRYRVLARYGKGDKVTRTLASSEGTVHFHRRAGVWPLPDGFRPTRLAVDSRGWVYAVGAGSGQIARFDAEGRRLPDLAFADRPPACLETGTLDGPGLALDSADNLYVVYNLPVEGAAPQAAWCKFDAEGRQLWQRPLQSIFARHIAIGGDDEIFIESISQLQQFDADGQLLQQKPIPALLVSSLRFWGGFMSALVEPLHTEVGWQSPRLVVYNDQSRSGYERVLGRDPRSPEDRGNGLLLRPSDFAVEGDAGRAFVVNAGAGRIEVFRDGDYLTRWGAAGSAAGAFGFSGSATVVDDIRSGSLAERRVVAGGIALAGGDFVFVADTFNDRLQRFER